MLRLSFWIMKACPGYHFLCCGNLLQLLENYILMETGYKSLAFQIQINQLKTNAS